MEEGGERIWRLAVDLGRKEGQLVLEFLCFLPRVQPEAPEAHRRPRMERRASCETCGVSGDTGTLACSLLNTPESHPRSQSGACAGSGT